MSVASLTDGIHLGCHSFTFCPLREVWSSNNIDDNSPFHIFVDQSWKFLKLTNRNILKNLLKSWNLFHVCSFIQICQPVRNSGGCSVATAVVVVVLLMVAVVWATVTSPGSKKLETSEKWGESIPSPKFWRKRFYDFIDLGREPIISDSAIACTNNDSHQALRWTVRWQIASCQCSCTCLSPEFREDFVHVLALKFFAKWFKDYDSYVFIHG